MKQAVIDIGSNSMRLTVYETNAGSFIVLFKDKVMAGLAGYVEEGVLSREGIARACQGLLSFQAVLEALDSPRRSLCRPPSTGRSPFPFPRKRHLS